VLIGPYYSKDFLIFSFVSSDTLAVVLLQKNDAGLEQPIAYFSRALRDAEVRYDIMEKQAYALVKALKYFRVYVLVITLNCTTHAYLASGQLISLPCENSVEQLFENPLVSRPTCPNQLLHVCAC
jgi:hypothetical protein